MSDGEIVRDVSHAAKLEACEDNLAAFVLYWARLAQSTQEGELRDTPELAWGISGLPVYLFNGVARTRLSAEPEAALDEHIAAPLAAFASRPLPMAWWVTPSSRPVDLARRLAAHGLRHSGDEPAMAVDLLTVPEQVSAPPSLSIEEVTDFAGLREAMDIVCASFGEPTTFTQKFVALLAGHELDDSLPFRAYLARLDGVPVATSQLFRAAGIAGIYAVATLPSARRQGVGAAITLAPLLAARALGYRLGILTASAMGYGVYQRLGFEEVCRFSTYALPSGDHRVDSHSGGQL